MATVISLTKAKIEELLAGWEGVELSQDQINALVAQLWTSQATLDAVMEEFQNVTLPQLQDDLAAGSVKVSELNDVTLPDLEATLDQNSLEIDNLNTVILPGLEADLNSTVENLALAPRRYVQEDPPTNPDIDDRDLVHGDIWIDTNNGNTQYRWNGTAWTTLEVDVADFSLTARKFLSTQHMIY